MRLTIEFDGEWWRVKSWWHALQCRITGHPGWKPPIIPTYALSLLFYGMDRRLRCVRCGMNDPTEPQPRPFVHSFHLGDAWGL